MKEQKKGGHQSLKILRLLQFTETLWVTALALLSCGSGDGKAQKDTGAHTGKPEGVCLPPESLGYLKKHRFLCIFYVERQRKDCGESLPEWSRERNARTGFEMEVKPTLFTFCPPQF